MPNTVTSPNMGIVVPVNLTDPSPDWGARLQTALFTTIDAHNHTAGNGALVPTAGLNINADLTFASFNATALRSSRYTSQGAPLALGTDVGCTYVSNGELWYNDLSSRQVQLTNVGNANFKFLAYAERTPAISGNFTILSTDAFSLYYVDTSGGVATVNLPASSGVAVGRTYVFVDIKRNASTNNITFVPNGADKINTVAGNYVVTANGSYTIVTTDAAGNWYANTISAPFDPLNIASNLQWVTGQANPTLTQASTSGATGQNITVAPQASTNANGTPGSFAINLAAPTGSGTIASLLVEQAGTTAAAMGPRVGVGPSQGCVWLGASGAPAQNNFVLMSTGGDAYLQAPNNGSTIHFQAANVQFLGNWSNTGLQLFSDTPSLGGGTKILGFTDATTEPTSNPAGGSIDWSFGGARKSRGSGGAITTTAPTGSGTQNSQSGTCIRTRTFARTTTTGATFTVDTPIPNTTTCYTRMQTYGRLVSGTGTVGDSFAAHSAMLFKTVAGTTTAVGLVETAATASDANMATATAAWSVSANNGRLTVTAPTGEGATPTIDWQVDIENYID